MTEWFPTEWLQALLPNGLLFLRPLWLLALIPLPFFVVLLARRPAGAGRWQDIIDAHLLRVLLQQGTPGKTSRLPLVLLALAWLLAALALAGPSVRNQDAPLFQRDSARIYVLDLSPSMNADDVKPSRLARARLKLLDALNQPRDGEQALMVYAGSAHVLTPLATDAKTLAAQVPVLGTELPPVRGNRPELALQRAVQMLKDAGHSGGEIVWLTNGIDADQIDRVIAAVADQNVRLAILALGTPEGAPVREAGALLTDNAGKVVLARLDLAPLQTVVDAVNGRLATLQADDSDWQALQFPETALASSTRRVDGGLALREDAGAWLLLPLLPLVLLAFRRGSLLPVLLLGITSFSPRSEAGWWQDLWQTPDQQAAQQLQQGDAKAAATTFRDPDWRATAQYRAGEFDNAAQSFATASAQGHYNRGNALAKAGKLDDAIAAYDQALQQQPDFTAAKENRAAVEKYRQQQRQQNPQQRDQQQEQQGQSDDNSAHAQQQSQQQSEQQPQQEPSDANQQTAQEPDQRRGEDPNQGSESSQTEATEAQQQSSDGKNEAKPDRQARTQQPQQNAADKQAEAATDDEQAPPANETPLPTALKQLPDDPGGLLRRKMKLEYLRRGQETQQQDQEQRW